MSALSNDFDAVVGMSVGPFPPELGNGEADGGGESSEARCPDPYE
jgi:hypothetical protein